MYRNLGFAFWGRESVMCIYRAPALWDETEKEKREQNDWPNIFFKNTTLKTVTGLVFNLIHFTLYKSKFHDTCTLKKKKENITRLNIYMSQRSSWICHLKLK